MYEDDMHMGFGLHSHQSTTLHRTKVVEFHEALLVASISTHEMVNRFRVDKETDSGRWWTQIGKPTPLGSPHICTLQWVYPNCAPFPRENQLTILWVEIDRLGRNNNIHHKV